MAAGETAARDAARQRDLADELARRAGIATQMARTFDEAARTDSRLAQTLIELEPLGYTLLTDRRWPGSKFATIDLVLVGPGGIVIIDAKGWRDVTIRDGRLFRGLEEVTDEMAQLADLVYTTQRALAEVGLAAGEVRAIAAFPQRGMVRTDMYGVSLLSEAATVTEIARLGTRLTQQQVAKVRGVIDTMFPPSSAKPVAIEAPTRPPLTATEIAAAGIQSPTFIDDELVAPEKLSAEQIRTALTEGLRRAPIDDWMSFLHPEQARIVRRTYTGPVRIRGAAGTGKTVVALHRAAHIARTTGGRVLVTTYVRTLPKVMEAQMLRLAPDVADRIDFRSVHGFAYDLLSSRTGTIAIEAETADRIFKDLWDRIGKESPLGAIDPTPGYWQDEVRYVLKGRGLTDFADYAVLPRLGRFRPLNGEQRAMVWNLYREYEIALQERGIFDWEDVILEAEASLVAAPLATYSAVIVDEAQDLSCAMIRMLHGLAGDSPDALTLVSDGQQTIYPGGYTLAEAGVAIQGRGVVLGVNYRNTAEIIEFAKSLVEGDRAPDIEGTVTVDDEPADVLRHGARPVYTVFSSRSVHDKSLVERIRRVVAENDDTELGDVGVLALYSWHAREAAEALTEAGIPTVELEKWDGLAVDAVKVGTIKRSKGLEFKEVLVVRTPPHLVQADVVDPDEAAAERRLLQRRELYVAMTRAREGLWVGVA
ncbi:MAG: UvrD-helicase domain-containing protein [Pseudolysinimonas sp.]